MSKDFSSPKKRKLPSHAVSPDQSEKTPSPVKSKPGRKKGVKLDTCNLSEGGSGGRRGNKWKNETTWNFCKTRPLGER